MSKNQQKKSEQAKQSLIQATASLIAERGSADSITFREIAERAGAPSASKITYHFQSRTNLLREVTQYILDNRCDNPVCEYLRRKGELLETREGQSLFICGLVDFFCEFFLDISAKEWNYSIMYRTLLHSEETQTVLDNNRAAFFDADALAFVQIYKKITGSDDFEQAYCWFSTIFVPLALQLTNQSEGKKLDADHVFSKQYLTRMIFFCRNRLLQGLGLTPLASPPAVPVAEERVSPGKKSR